MPHFAMEPVAAFLRAIVCCGRKPVRIGHVTRSLVRIERVTAMYAGPGLAHTVQVTPHGPKIRWLVIQNTCIGVNYKFVRKFAVTDVLSVPHNPQSGGAYCARC